LETAVLAQRRGAYVRADIRASVAHLTWAKSASLLFATYQQSLEITASNKLNKSHLQRSDVF
jgi:hypothetical protein